MRRIPPLRAHPSKPVGAWAAVTGTTADTEKVADQICWFDQAIAVGLRQHPTGFATAFGVQKVDGELIRAGHVQPVPDPAHRHGRFVHAEQGSVRSRATSAAVASLNAVAVLATWALTHPVETVMPHTSAMSRGARSTATCWNTTSYTATDATFTPNWTGAFTPAGAGAVVV